MKLFSIVFFSLLCLNACATKQLEPTMAKEQMADGRYTLSDNYANHRLQQKSINTSGGKLAVLDVGTGPALVLIHGVPTSSWMYRKMVADLQSDFRVIAIDLLGYGGSDKPTATDSNYLPSSQASYIQEVLAQLGVQQHNLVFHDMGGLVAWELVNRDIVNGDKISSLTILNTIISKQGFDYPKMEKGMLAKAQAKAYANNLTSAAILDMTFRNMGLTSNAKLTEGECFGYVAPMREGADEALYEFFTSFDEQRFASLDKQIKGLKGYRGKAQVLWGAEDKVLTTKQLPQLTTWLNIDKVDITIYANNAHFLAEEIPAQIGDKIRNFVSGPARYIEKR